MLRPRQPARHLHVRRRVPGGNDRRAVEREGAAQTIERRGSGRLRSEHEVDRGAPGEVALLRRILEQRREIQPRQIDGTLRAEVRRREIGGDLALDAAGLGCDVEIEPQRLTGPLAVTVNAGFSA